MFLSKKGQRGKRWNLNYMKYRASKFEPLPRRLTGLYGHGLSRLS